MQPQQPYAQQCPQQPGQQPMQPSQPPQAQWNQQQPYPPQPAMPPQPMPQTNGYNPYAYPGEYDQPKAKGPNIKLIAIIGGAVLLLIIIGAVVATSGGNGNSGNAPTSNTQGTTEQSTSDAGKDIIDRTDNTLDLSKKINNKETLKPQTLKAKTGQQVNLSSGFSFMVTKTEDFSSSNPTTKPANGKKFVIATVIVGNRNQSGNISVSYLDFRLRDKSNQLLAGSGATNEVLNNPLASPTELKPGEQLTGKVVFEVNSNETDWVFKHSETYQKTTDDTTFTVEGEIVIQLATAPASDTGTTGQTGGDTTTSGTSTTN